MATLVKFSENGKTLASVVIPFFRGYDLRLAELLYEHHCAGFLGGFSAMQIIGDMASQIGNVYLTTTDSDDFENRIEIVTDWPNARFDVSVYREGELVFAGSSDQYYLSIK